MRRKIVKKMSERYRTHPLNSPGWSSGNAAVMSRPKDLKNSSPIPVAQRSSVSSSKST